MNKGIVVKIKKSYAIVLSSDNDYVRIEKKNNMSIGQKIYFLEENILKPTTSKEMNMKNKVIAIATVACLFVLAVIGTNILPTQAYALVSIDINPSIDIKIDEDQNVIEIIPLNDDATLVYSDDMIGEPVLQVIEGIIENAKIQKFLTDENNNILISSAVLEGDDLEDLGSIITDYLENDMNVPSNVRVIYIESDAETAEESEETGVSLGRLELTKITKDEKTKENPISETVADEAVDMELAEKVVIEDDSVLESLQNVVSKLRVVETEEGSELSTFLSLFDENNSPIDPAADLHELLVLAKGFWKPVMHEYQQEWAALQDDDDDDAVEDDDDEDDNDLLESQEEFIGKLRLMLAEMTSEHEGYEEISQWLTQLDADQNSGTPLEIKNQARDLVNKYKDGFQLLWEDDEDEMAEDLADLEELLAKLENTGNDEFIAQVRAEMYEATQFRIRQLKDEAKGIFQEIKDRDRDSWEDGDEEDVIEKLEELEEKFGDVEGVADFIASIRSALELENPDYKALEELVEDQLDALEDEDEDKGNKDQDDDKGNKDQDDDKGNQVDDDDDDDDDDRGQGRNDDDDNDDDDDDDEDDEDDEDND